MNDKIKNAKESTGGRFKIGDRVILVNNVNLYFGAVGEIVEETWMIKSGAVKYRVNFDNICYIDWFFEWELKLLEEIESKAKFKVGDEVYYSYGITYRHGRIIEVRYDSKTEGYEYYICAHLPACYGCEAPDIEYVWKKEEKLMPDTIKEIEIKDDKLRTPMYNVGDKVLYSLSGNALMAGTIKEIKPTENDILYKISYSDNVDAMWVSEENIQGLSKVPVGKLEPDNVNHPSHYETGKFECIEVMEEALGRDAVRSFCLCNAFKYIYRHKRKNGDEDIKKAQWYINKYLELSNKEEVTES